MQRKMVILQSELKPNDYYYRSNVDVVYALHTSLQKSDHSNTACHFLVKLYFVTCGEENMMTVCMWLSCTPSLYDQSVCISLGRVYM